MLSEVREITLRRVRATLAVLWLCLIASLLFAPYEAPWLWKKTPALANEVGSAAAPSASAFPSLRFDDFLNPSVAPPLTAPTPPAHWGNQIFWGLLIPLVPIFLMLLGHEAWRRICPLSFFSQLPRYLGWQYKRKFFNRSTGLVEKNVALVKANSWLARYHWYLQFGLLTVAVIGRLLWFNANPVALGVLLLGVISCAVLVGVLWGGKTWCQYFCPVSVVQKVYTQPGGLLESQPHKKMIAISQSMCRTTQDTSACVACVTHCPDIDLEKHHWQHLRDPSRQLVYYGLFGLIAGFFSYFYLYAGDWTYYFSGAWLRDPHDIASAPGFYFWPAVPRWLAASLWCVLCMVVSYGLWRGVEFLYVRYHRKKFPDQAANTWDPHARHQVLMVSAFASCILFYRYAGFGYMSLLPDALHDALDLAIVVIASWWLARALARSPKRYADESALKNSPRKTD